MSILTKYGTAWGHLPVMGGNVHFVSPSANYTLCGKSYTASDGNDGTSPESALLTPAQAISNATANAGDVIALLPGTHSSASNVAVNKAGLTFIAMHPYSYLNATLRSNPLATKVNWTSTLAGTAITVTAADTTFVGINFIPVTARTAVSFSGAAARMAVVDCGITLSAAASVSTKGFVASAGADSVTFSNLSVLNTIGAQGPALDLTGCTNFLLDHPTYLNTTGSWAVGVQFGAASQGMVREGDMACSGTAITIGYDGTGVAANKSIIFLNNRFGVSPGAGAIKNFTAAFAELVNNWFATVGGGAGFVIVTVVA